MSAHRDAIVLRTGTSHAGRSNLPHTEHMEVRRNEGHGVSN